MEAISRFFLLAIILCMPFAFLNENIDSDSISIDNLEFSDIGANIIEDTDSNSLLRSFIVKPNYDFTSPYQAIPGTYDLGNNSYFLGNGGLYNPKSQYANYLASGAYSFYSKNCLNHYGQVPRISQLDLDNAFSYANFQIDQRYPEYSNLSHYKETAHKEIEGRLLELVSEYFAKFKCFSKYQLTATLPVLNINKQYQTKNRHGDVSCTPFYDQNYQCLPHLNSKYRTIDGSCNNKLHPYWGRSSICHIRLLPADYSDGIQAFRMSKNGLPLPNPRFVSNHVALLKDFKSFYTTLLLAYGQFINHDISNTENYKDKPNGQKIDCCVKPDSKCATMPITGPNDYILSKFNTKCFNFVRSSSCPLCKLGPRQQLNTQTSFLDGSQIYGKNDKESSSLRAFKNGLMASVPNFRRQPILPPSASALPCTPLKPGLKCFVAGDNRVNQHPLLTTMHTLFVRLHNYHASNLQRVNPRWSDEKLFQEARRIVIAQIQHIAYNEYLTVILGSLLTNYYSLNPLLNGYTHYEPFTDPTTWNEFSTAASRYGHSQIKDHYKTIPFNLINASQILLKDNFFEPGFAWDGLIDDIIRGMINDVSNTVDPYYSITSRNFVMRPKNAKHGIDLVATNIMRGRDHGIPGYVHFLKACFNYEARTWKDLENFIPAETLNRLRAVYSSIEDIDLYIAGVSERHFIDASIGPTFGCLVGVQFYHLKFGDRYYYEHGGQSGSFRLDQLSNIRATTSFSQVLCRSSNLKSVQPKAFYLPSRYNQIGECVAYPDINYQLWRE